MKTIASGIAHVSFVGGGLFLPARSPYDRQLLVEHVGERVRAKGQVQVLLGEQIWLVRRNPGPAAAVCSNCGSVAASACYATTVEGGGLCLECALCNDPEAARPQRAALERRVG